MRFQKEAAIALLKVYYVLLFVIWVVHFEVDNLAFSLKHLSLN